MIASEPRREPAAKKAAGQAALRINCVPWIASGVRAVPVRHNRQAATPIAA